MDFEISHDPFGQGEGLDFAPWLPFLGFVSRLHFGALGGPKAPHPNGQVSDLRLNSSSAS